MTKKTFLKGLISATMVATMALPMVAMAQGGSVTANELLPNEIGTNIGTGTTDIRITIARIIRTAIASWASSPF